VRAVVVAHGEVDPADAAHVRGADLVIAADGGSEHLRRWGIAPHVVIGDLDSLAPDGAHGARVERYPREKDRTDTELAVDRAIASGADEIVILGALGGPRVDHALANALLLAQPRGQARISIVRGPMRMRIVRAGERLGIEAEEGEIVTLLPVGGDARGVRTEGLRYALRGETLRFGSSRGVSNEVSAAAAAVSLEEGALLVVEGGALAAGAAEQPKA
jgi:thiamine pyrophosphokinase